MARNVSLRILASGAIDLKSIKERDFQVAIGKYAEERGWKIEYRTRSAVKLANGNWRGTGPAGFPDLFMAREGEAISAELKREVGGKAGQPTDEQQEWLDLLETVPGISAFHWKPSDSEYILGRLK